MNKVKTMRYTWLLSLVLISLFPVRATADSWPGAVIKEEFSESREVFVRVIPGESFGDTFGFAGEKKGKYARAELYRVGDDKSYKLMSQWDLLNPVAPIDFYVSNDGTLVTFDNWHNMGYGHVVVLYEQSGKRIQSYTLEELYSESLLAQIAMSVSSRWWRDKPIHFINNQTEIFVPDTVGGYFIFSTGTGKFQSKKKEDRK
jgi:hypothetical protein